jgi:hypothetical protein
MMQSLWPLVRSAVEVILPAGFSTGEVETERLQDLTRLKGKLVFRQNGQVSRISMIGRIYTNGRLNFCQKDQRQVKTNRR